MKSNQNIEDIALLSPLQRGMLFHSLSEQDANSRPYFSQTRCRLVGKLDLAAFEQAWQLAEKRHASLRAAIYWKDLNNPVQVFHKNSSLRVTSRDLSALDEDAQRAAITRYLEEDSRQGFDLSQTPLFRVAILRLSENSHQLVMTHHHVILDGWSMPILFDEVFRSYEAFRNGKEAGLVTVRPYTEYIKWLQKQDSKRAEGFWRQRLKGFDSPTDVGIGRTSVDRNAVGKSFCNEERIVTPEVGRRLTDLVQQSHVTLNTFVQGAWGVLLGIYSGTDDVIFGGTVAGRPASLPGVERMVGQFVNTLPVRVRLPESETVIEWLGRLQREQVETREYEYSSLVDVQAWSEISKGLQLFSTVVVFENYPIGESPGGGDGGASLRVEQVEGVEYTNYSLTLFAVPSPKGLKLSLSYDAALFEKATILRLLGHLERIFETFVARPQATVGELEVLSEVEKHQLLHEWNATKSAYPASKCIHELFEEQVARTPDAMALIALDARWSYRELDRRANQLACHLQSLGLGAESLVGVGMGRSAETIVALFGILKSGAAYVPLDLANPPERLNGILHDVKVQTVVTTRAVQQKMGFLARRIIFIEDLLESEPSAEQAQGIRVKIDPENLAYVIFTSGSTGKPKGVQVCHRTVVARVEDMRKRLEILPTDRVLGMTTISFDPSVVEIFNYLTAGAAVVTVSDELARDGHRLKALLEREPVDVIQTTPGSWAMLLEAGWKAAPSAKLKKILIGGEALPEALVEPLLANSHQVWNIYGPTETTVWSTACRILTADQISVGRPVDNAEVYLLDARLRPVPVGVKGEVYIGGEGVTRGYLDPELTAERFVPNPFGPIPGGRMYRTGDLACYDRSGNIVYAGRADHQVKLRGVRIEFGEIENWVGKHQSVAQNKVILREDLPGGRQLVAYVVAKAGVAFSRSLTTDLREFLKKHLPEVMVPLHFVVLEALPLNPNGKVDRRALPLPDTQPVPVPGTRSQGPHEDLLAGLWRKILNVKTVASKDSFFELGGHSLLATQLVSQIRSLFKVELPLSVLFENPTLVGLAGKIRELLDAGTHASGPGIARIKRDEAQAHELSFAQERLWFIDQLEPGNVAYNVPIAVRLSGLLDPVALERSFGEIIRRHEALRTRFKTVQGRALQQIAESQVFLLAIQDLSSLAPKASEERVRGMALQEGQRPFDLSQGPLLRASLLKVAPSEHVLLVTMHHIVSDGWSMGVLVNEMSKLYGAFAAGLPSPLPELAIQYSDYAHWQRERLKGKELERQLDYWKNKLAGALTVLDLPTDNPRPPIQSQRGAEVVFRIEGPLYQRLKTFCEQEGVTLYMALLASLNVLLAKYTGQDDILVGSPIANRQREETENLIGFFLNTLVMRTNLAGNPTFRQLLKTVRENTLEAYGCQDLPFETLISEISPERDLSRSALAQVMFTFQNTPQLLREPFAGVAVSLLETTQTTAKDDLWFILGEERDSLFGNCVYNSDLFEQSTIERMARHFERILDAVTKRSDVRLSELELLSSAERTQMLVDWNATQGVYPTGKCIQELFTEQAMATPEAIAVSFEGREVSYKELDERTNRLGRYLRGRGVEGDVLVGVCLERSIEMVESVLGVLKAGGAYVPLDPSYPKDRLEYMLSDSGVSLVLTTEHLKGVLSGYSGQVVPVDGAGQRRAIERESKAAFKTDTSVDHLAYVIYTSGSTGKPKGVALAHLGLSNMIKSQIECFDLGPHDRLLQFASMSFDTSVWEMFVTLVSGAELCLEPRELSMPGPDLIRALKARRITIVALIPSVVQTLGSEEFPDLRKLICAGEECPAQTAQRWVKGRRFFNVYGPTEISVTATVFEVQPASGPHAVPIGRPITNTQVYVLDAGMNPVPIGVAGELYVGGIQLARGYLNRPELTAERFVPDPYSRQAGGRLYRTGDKAKYLPDGHLEFLGRADTQVKVRGFRIELGEIEARLLETGLLTDAVVIAREDEPGRKQLAAYFVKRGNGVESKSLSSQELRQSLKAKVPEYMVPSFFVELEKIPLMPNGKVDRRALPKPTTSILVSAEAAIEPRTEREKLLAAIFCRVLKVERVGVTDNFFELGGDSILSVQIAAHARQGGIAVTPRQIFQHQTIEELAQVATECGAGSSVVSEQGEVRGELELVPSQRRFFEHENPEPWHYNQAVMFKTRQRLEVECLERALLAVLGHHDALRLKFERKGDSKSGGSEWRAEHVGAPRTVAELRGKEVLVGLEVTVGELEASADRLQKSLSLEEGRLFRVGLFDLGPGLGQRILFVVHHLVVDGVSWRILLEDIQSAYEQALRGEVEIRLSAKTSSFKSWSEKLGQYGGSEPLKARELEYWRGLAQAAKSQAQVASRAQVAAKAGGGALESINVALSARRTEELLKEIPEVYHTQINDVLLTALGVVLSEWSGTKQVLVDLEGHGREEEIVEGVDLSRTVGWFTTVYPVRLDLEGLSGEGERLKGIKEQLRSIPNKGIGYGALKYLSDQTLREEFEAVRPVVSFNYLGQFDQVLSGSKLFEEAEESRGEDFSARTVHSHRLSVDACVMGGRLEIAWKYQRHLDSAESIERLAAHYLQTLESLIEHCKSPQAGGFTKSDFPLVGTEFGQLEDAASEIQFDDE